MSASDAQPAHATGTTSGSCVVPVAVAMRAGRARVTSGMPRRATLPRALAGVSFPSSSPGPGCPRRRGPRGSSGSGQCSAVAGSKQATTNTRRRRWGTPKNRASKTAHSMTSAPASARESSTAAKSQPLELERAPRTFSQTAHRGSSPPVSSRSSRMMRTASPNSPEREPASPARLPAVDRSWHGEPKTTTSGRTPSASNWRAVTSRTSSYSGTPGQCRARTRRACGSISHSPTVVAPAASNPRSIPPAPENRESTFTAAPGGWRRRRRSRRGARCGRRRRRARARGATPVGLPRAGRWRS